MVPQTGVMQLGSCAFPWKQWLYCFNRTKKISPQVLCFLGNGMNRWRGSEPAPFLHKAHLFNAYINKQFPSVQKEGYSGAQSQEHVGNISIDLGNLRKHGNAGPIVHSIEPLYCYCCLIILIGLFDASPFCFFSSVTAWTLSLFSYQFVSFSSPFTHCLLLWNTTLNTIIYVTSDFVWQAVQILRPATQCQKRHAITHASPWLPQ